MGLIKTCFEKIITFFNIDDECYSNIEILLKEKTTQHEPKAKQKQTKHQPTFVENYKPINNLYVENYKPYVENYKLYVENYKHICRKLQIGLLKTTTNNNINNNLYNNEINNLTNNDFLVEEDGDINLLKELFDFYKDEKSLDLELKVEYRILFNKLKSEKYYHIDKYRIAEYGII
jgi:hypothetical protein